MLKILKQIFGIKDDVDYDSIDYYEPVCEECDKTDPYPEGCNYFDNEDDFDDDVESNAASFEEDDDVDDDYDDDDD